MAGELVDERVNLALGIHVDAARWLVEKNHLGRGGEPFGENDLLLVSAGEVDHGGFERRGPDAEAFDEGSDVLRFQ